MHSGETEMLRSGVFGILCCLVVPAVASADLEIHCLDVGQGDATLVVSSSGQTLLFDGGSNGKGTGVVNPYLASLGIADLTYMAASHYHEDHIGGLDEVYSGTGVDVACYDRGWSYTTLTYQDYANTVAPKRQTLTEGQVIDLGDGVGVRCVALNGNGELAQPFEQPPHNENDLCVVLLVSCGDFDFFVAGDLSGENTSSYEDIETSVAAEMDQVEVYQVDHHGSRYNSNLALVAALSPEVSVISVGNNSYGHPSQQAIDRLVDAGSYIYQTELGSGGTIPPGSGRVVGGHVVIETDGVSSYTVDGDVYTLSGTAVCEAGRRPAAGIRLSVSPNPLNPTTGIRYLTPALSECGRLTLYDVRGREVRRWEIAGEGEVFWDGTDAGGSLVASGVYFCRMVAGGECLTEKLVLAR